MLSTNKPGKYAAASLYGGFSATFTHAFAGLLASQDAAQPGPVLSSYFLKALLQLEGTAIKPLADFHRADGLQQSQLPSGT